MNIHDFTTIVSVRLVHGELHVVRRTPSFMLYPTNPPKQCPDHVFKDIYGIEGDIIVLKKTINGRHTPQAVIPESIEFPDGVA